MRQTLKFFHTLASCGMVGALLAYGLVLLNAPPDAAGFAAARQTIALLCNALLLPSMGLALVTGLFSMAVHRPFQQRRWAWVKALLGISVFELTLAIVQSKANYAASISAAIANGGANDGDLAAGLTYEWHSLAVIMALSIANIVLGVWRPRLKRA